MRFVCWQIFVCRIHSSLAFLCFFLSCCWCENSFSMFFLLHNVVFFPHNSRASSLPPTTVDDVVSYAIQTTSTQRVYWKACKLYSTLKLPAISEVLIKVNLILISCLLYDFVYVSEIINSNYGVLPRGGAACDFEGNILSFGWVNFVGKFAIVVSSSPSWSTESSLKIHPMKFLIQFPDYEVNV